MSEHDLIIASIYASTLLKSNNGIETISYELSQKNLGSVSKVFKKIIRDEKKGIPVKEGIERLANSKQDLHIKSFAAALLLNDQTNFYEMITESINDKKIKMEDLLERVSILSNWLVILTLAPLGILLIEFFNMTMASYPGDLTGFNMNAFIIPDPAKPIILLISAAALIILCMLYKLK
jgi:hypothetical protein